MEEQKGVSFLDIWRTANPPKKTFAIGLFFSMLSTIAGLGIPLLIKDLMEGFSNGFSFSTLGVIAGLLLFEFLCEATSMYMLSRVGEGIVQIIREKAWRKLLNLPVNYYDKNKSGEMISRVTNDTTVLMTLISDEIVQLITNALSIVVSIIILFILDVPMTLVLLLAVPITLLIVFPLGKKLADLSDREQEQMSELTAFLSQTLGEIKLIKSYNAERIEYKRGKNKFQSLFQYGMKQAKIKSILGPALGMCTIVVLMSVVGFGVWRVDRGYISSGELVAFILYLFQILMPFVQMNQFVTSFQEAKGSTRRLFQILHEKEEHAFLPQKVDIPEKLEFQNVRFHYNERDPILKDISFTVRKGTTTALVGPSGAGKSTIFSLMERFYEPTDGDIFLNGKSYREMNIEAWRKHFSYVAQAASLLSGTITDNITYGMDRNVSPEEVVRAAKLANAHEFIMAFPDGYETEVGERGNQLSGGQKQRIAIARALLRDTEFLLLDEATASLDSESEAKIQKAIENVFASRTTFVIAHRLSTVVQADTIFVIENGSITGIGIHDELMKHHTYYKKIVEQQFLIEKTKDKIS
ncbi:MULTISPECIES: ABC transporter ATP-binding protein [Bacillus]|uniref:Multidrug ABC transporter permease n=1 Tax=Bacillus pseudomycoides TaxID=64104 RepID=A0A1Y3MHS1_9BACI|nr:ABC transporter ATP-binding protein [Bacillus pseudomycoides]OUM47152.1 multidrug ABC transporter permease [Bacillus pseudomycoides]